MATNNKAKSSTKPQDEDVITIELQNLLIPLAIIVAGVIISSSLLYGLKTYGVGTGAGSNGGNVNVQEPGGEDLVEVEAGQVSIDDDPYLGDKDTAKVAIVEFSDFECPYCQRHWQETHAALVEKYVETGDAILVYRDLPIVSIHASAQPAAVASNCAREQGGDKMYFAYHDEIFSAGLTSTTQLEGFAKNIGLNINEFNTCLASGKYDDEIDKDIADAAAAGIQSTPSFVIGLLDEDGNVDGVSVIGAQALATFEAVIEEQLAR